MLSKILRYISNITHWLLFGLLVRLVIMGKNNIFITIVLCFYGIEIFFDIKNAISNKNNYRNMYRRYREMFEKLKYMHKVKYGLYFSGDTEQVDQITNDFQECATEQLELGEMLLENPKFNLKEKEEIQKIIDQTRYLLKNVQPPV